MYGCVTSNRKALHCIDFISFQMLIVLWTDES